MNSTKESIMRIPDGDGVTNDGWKEGGTQGGGSRDGIGGGFNWVYRPNNDG